MASAAPGYWTFTATARSCSSTGSHQSARWTWPIEAAAIGVGSHSTNSFSGAAPSSCSTIDAASSPLMGGAWAWSWLKARRSGSGSPSSR